MRRLQRIIVPLLIAMMGVVLAAAPAQADSGGGCRTVSFVGSCISRIGNYLYADFYLSTNPDFSRCKATLAIIVDGVYREGATYNLTRQGRYGPISENVASLPLKNQQAYATTTIYRCDWTPHYTVNSPTLYYKA